MGKRGDLGGEFVSPLVPYEYVVDEGVELKVVLSGSLHVMSVGCSCVGGGSRWLFSVFAAIGALGGGCFGFGGITGSACVGVVWSEVGVRLWVDNGGPGTAVSRGRSVGDASDPTLRSPPAGRVNQ